MTLNLRTAVCSQGFLSAWFGHFLHSVCVLHKCCGAPWVCVVTISEIPAVCAHSKNNLAPVERAGGEGQELQLSEMI